MTYRESSKAVARVKQAIGSCLAMSPAISYNGRMRQHSARRAFIVFAGAGLLVCAGMTAAGNASAGCVVEASAEKAGPLKRHLGSGCTPLEREAQAVESSSIMRAIIKGRSIDLRGVVIRGDLSFDSLPVQAVRTPKALSPEQRKAPREISAGEVRSVSVPVTIRDAVVQGTMRHRSERGTLLFEAPVDFHGTRFMRGVDLSRSVFRQSLDISAAEFDREAYWVQGQFGAALNCASTRFGPHTRFHLAVFRGPVDCSRALFDGLAEFLETTFEQTARFGNARFGLGTGFSGSRFGQRVEFSDAIFSRAAFFTYVRFDADATFAGAQFLAETDFSNAEFKKADDLSLARFDRPPLFKDTKRIDQGNDTGSRSSTGTSYAVTLILLVVAALLAAAILRVK